MRMLQADLFRIRKERLSLVSLILLLGLSVAIGYGFGRMGNRELALVSAPQVLTPFLCLFFITPAKIFFGEDFSLRTINNSVVKAKGRLGLYLYRSLATIVCSLLYVVIGFLSVAVTYHLLTGEQLYANVMAIVVRQSLFYLTSATLAILVFNCFRKMYQSNTFYILLVMVGEQFFDLFFSLILKTDIHKPFMVFSHLVDAITTSPNQQAIGASLILLILFVVTGYGIFSRREFK